MTTDPSSSVTIGDQAIRRGYTTIVLLLAVAALLVLTMPRFIYVGDPVAIRMTTIRWLTHGEISVPAEVAQGFGERGQYFFEHPRTHRWYCKYGVLNTFLYAPPLLVEELFVGNLKYFADLTEQERLFRCLLLNVWNVAIALVLASYLYHAASVFSSHPTNAAQLVVTVIFGTFLWHYIRAQTVELFQVTLFTAAFFHLLKAERAGFGVNGRWHSVAALACVGLLAFSKLIYVVTIPIFAACMVIGVLRQSPAATLRAQTVTLWRSLRIETGLMLLCIAALGFANWYRFGAPWTTGYQQFERENTLFRVGFEGLYGYLVDPQKSVFLYFPVLIISLACVWRVGKTHRLSYGAAWACFFVCYALNASFVNWRGDWSYGPRYLLFALPVLSLPAASAFSNGLVERRLRVIGVSLLLAFSLATINSPLSVHLAGFFSTFQAEQVFDDADAPEVAAYFQQPQWIISRDLRRFLMQGDSFEPLDRAVHRQPDLDQERLRHALASIPFGNYYWPAAIGSRQTSGRTSSARTALSAGLPER